MRFPRVDTLRGDTCITSILVPKLVLLSILVYILVLLSILVPKLGKHIFVFNFGLFA